MSDRIKIRVDSVSKVFNVYEREDASGEISIPQDHDTVAGMPSEALKRSYSRRLERNQRKVQGGKRERKKIRRAQLYALREVSLTVDRGEVVLQARVTERIMPGVVNLSQGAWYDPDESGIDRGGCANTLTRDEPSPGGAFPYNTCLVQVEKV